MSMFVSSNSKSNDDNDEGYHDGDTRSYGWNSSYSTFGKRTTTTTTAPLSSLSSSSLLTKEKRSTSSSPSSFRWEYLQSTETHRREILKQVELPFGQILFCHWKGSCFKALATDWLLHLSMLIFIIIRCCARHSLIDRTNTPSVVIMLQDGNIEILGGFLSFVLVLFVNQTNARFFEMYQLSKAAAGRIQDVAGYCAAATARGQLTYAWCHRLVRYLNAAHVVGYVGLNGGDNVSGSRSSPYRKDNFFDQLNQPRGLLLTDEELHQRMVHGLNMNAGSAAFKELITWCQMHVGMAQHDGGEGQGLNQRPEEMKLKKNRLSVYEVTELQRRILQVRAAMDGIYDFRDQPTAYFYIHLICLLSFLYVPLFAIASAYQAGWGPDELEWSKELLAATMVFVQTIFVVGLRSLGQRMIDPYQDDWEDLSVITYVTTTIENCRIILDSTKHYRPHGGNSATSSNQDDDAVEEELMNRMHRNMSQGLTTEQPVV